MALLTGKVDALVALMGRIYLVGTLYVAKY